MSRMLDASAYFDAPQTLDLSNVWISSVEQDLFDYYQRTQGTAFALDHFTRGLSTRYDLIA